MRKKKNKNIKLFNYQKISKTMLHVETQNCVKDKAHQ